jgi:hypothetical protein
MAERIDSITPSRGRAPIYPWGEWLDGSAWRIERGVDFEVPTDSMAAMVRMRASKAGLTATARVVGDAVEFQVLSEEKAA